MTKRIVSIVNSGYNGHASNGLFGQKGFDKNQRQLTLKDAQTGEIIIATGDFSGTMSSPIFSVFSQEELKGAFILASGDDIGNSVHSAQAHNATIIDNDGLIPVSLQRISTQDRHVK